MTVIKIITDRLKYRTIQHLKEMIIKYGDLECGCMYRMHDPLLYTRVHSLWFLLSALFLIKYTHNTYARMTRKIPLFRFRNRKRTAVSVTSNIGACLAGAHALWMMTEWPEWWMLLTVIMPCLTESLLRNFDNWRLTYTITTSKRDRIGLSCIKRSVTNPAKANMST